MDPLSHQFRRLAEAARQAKHIVIVGHEQPDGDAIGACTAVAEWLRGEGKNPVIFCPDPPAPRYRFMDGFHRITNDPSAFHEHVDLVVCCDCAVLERARITEALPRVKRGCLVANIDHHATNPGYGDILAVDGRASSTVEVVFRFLSELRAPINEAIATSLLTGLAFDTTSFTNSATSGVTMNIAGKLLANGARMNEIATNLWRSSSPNSLKLWGRLLSRLAHYEAWSLAVTYVTLKDLEELETEPEGFINFLMSSIRNVDTVLVFKEKPDGRIRGSMRSATKDISQIALAFGGGGLTKAAGFELEAPLSLGADGTIILPEPLTKALEKVLGV